MSGMNVVAHNLQGMAASRYLGITGGNQAKSTEKLSSGYKINRAADDAAGLAISEKMRKQIRGLTRGTTNAEDGVSMCQIADGALNEVHDMIHRITELSVKSANGTNSAADRQAIQAEVDQIIGEIDRVAETSKFNEIYLFKPNMGISSSSAKTVISNAEIRSQLINGTFPAITEPVRTADSNVPAISAEHATGLMNIMSSMLIADEISRMDVRFKEEPDDVMLRAGELVMRSHMNMVSIYPVMVDVNDPATIPVHGQATMNPEHMDDVMSSVELSGIMHAFSDSGSNVWATRYRSSPKPYDASQVANLRQEILFTDVIKGAGHGYNDATWLKAQSTLLNSIEENNGGYWRTEGDYVMEDYGAGRFADLAYGYFQKATGITSGKLQGLCRDLLGGGTGSKREGIAASVYKYMYGIDDSPEGDGYNRIWIQSGADAGDGMPVDIRAMNATILGIADLDVSSEGGATDAIDTADAALQKLSSMRSLIGAQQNRLEHTIANQKNIIENTQHAESVIRDADMAEEMVRFSKESILQQAGQSMLAQANHSTEGILALLR